MSPAKILLVEDDKFIREIYRDSLISGGYSPEIAIDGEEAFEKMKKGGWDIVLLDIILPKLTGFEIIEKLKSTLNALPNKAIVFLTNVDDTIEKEKAASYGFDYIIKSQITPEDLLGIVKRYLQN